MLEQRPAVERAPGTVAQVGLGHTGEHRQGGTHVDEPGVLVDVPAPPDARTRQQQRGPGLHDVERPVLAHVAALVGEVVPGRVHHRDVG